MYDISNSNKSEYSVGGGGTEAKNGIDGRSEEGEAIHYSYSS